MEYHYNAFISYNHNPRDMKIARLLQHKLESYKVPAGLQSSAHSKLERVFLDTGELEVSGDLNDVIQNALRNSDFLIVICSPESKTSVWVRKEMEFFLQNHTIDQILTVITEGEPFDVLPDRILYEDEVNEETGETERVFREPLSCDYRLPVAKANKQELPRLVAALIGCRYDDLIQRQRAYRRKRQIALLVSTAVMLTSAVSYLVWSNHRIKVNYESTLREQSVNLAAQSEKSLSQGDRLGAVRYALEALPTAEKPRPVVSEAVEALARALNLYQTDENDHWNSVKQYSYDSGLSREIPFSIGDTSYLAAICRNGRVRIWNTDTYEEIMADYTQSLFDSGTEIHSACVSEDKDLILMSSEKIIAVDIKGSAERYSAAVTSGAKAGEPITVNPMAEDQMACKGDSLWVMACRSDQDILCSIDLETGKTVKEIPVDDSSGWALRLSDDKSHIALLNTGYGDDDQSHSTVKVYDTSGGDLIQTFEREYATDIEFGDNDHLMICGFTDSHDISDHSVSQGAHYITSSQSYSWSQSKRRTIGITSCDISDGNVVWSIERENMYHGSPQLEFAGREGFYADDVICTTGNDVLVFDKSGKVIDQVDLAADIRCYTNKSANIRAVLSDGSMAVYYPETGELTNYADVYFDPVIHASYDQENPKNRLFVGTRYSEFETDISSTLQYEVTGSDPKWESYEDLDYTAYEDYDSSILEPCGDCFIEIMPVDFFAREETESVAHIVKRKISDGTVVLDKEIAIKGKGESEYSYAGIDSDQKHVYFAELNGADGSSLVSVDLETGEAEKTDMQFTSEADFESDHRSVDIDAVELIESCAVVYNGSVYIPAARRTVTDSDDYTDTEEKRELIVIEADAASGRTVTHTICEIGDDQLAGIDLVAAVDPAGGKVLLADNTNIVTCYNMNGKKLSATKPFDFFPGTMCLTDRGSILVLEELDGSNCVLHVLNQKKGTESAQVKIPISSTGRMKFLAQTADEEAALLVYGSYACVLGKEDWSLRGQIKNYCTYNAETATFILGETGTLSVRKYCHVPHRSLQDMIADGTELVGQ